MTFLQWCASSFGGRSSPALSVRLSFHQHLTGSAAGPARLTQTHRKWGHWHKPRCQFRTVKRERWRLGVIISSNYNHPALRLCITFNLEWGVTALWDRRSRNKMLRAQSQVFVSHSWGGVTTRPYAACAFCVCLCFGCITACQLVLVAQVHKAQSCFIAAPNPHTAKIKKASAG